MATIRRNAKRRPAALRAFYRFLSIESDDAPPNPVLHGRHAIRKGRRLPRDVSDADLDKLFAAIPTCMARRAVLQYLHISWKGVVG